MAWGCLRPRVGRWGWLLRLPDPVIPPEDGQPISRAPAWEICDLCSATCLGLAPSRCCRRFAESIVAISRRIS
jgi:hypothetical protein